MLPVLAHAPMEMHHLGCGIWSQIVRMTGASLNGTRPAQISTSAWRGEKAMRSMPNRARSKRLAAVAMNSMAQHAVPNAMGQSELARDQLTRKSSRVVSQLGELVITPVVLSSGGAAGPDGRPVTSTPALLARS